MVELDVQASADGVPVIAHSSPIELYESLDCGGQRIEEMTAAEVTACHLAPSTSETFQLVGDVLDNAAGRALIELEVKETGDLQAVIEFVLARGAQDRAFFLLGVDEVALLPTLAGGDQVWAMARIHDVADVPAMLAAPRVIVLELDRSYPGADEAAISALISDSIHPAGRRALTSSDTRFATLDNQREVFALGFDTLLSYGVPDGVQAAREVNVANGLPP
jgi:hypothetical protein